MMSQLKYMWGKQIIVEFYCQAFHLVVGGAK
jgi:hypothetical protein